VKCCHESAPNPLSICTLHSASWCMGYFRKRVGGCVHVALLQAFNSRSISDHLKRNDFVGEINFIPRRPRDMVQTVYVINEEEHLLRKRLNPKF
jgi:hypothetical protein